MRIFKTLLLGIFVCSALGLRGQELEWVVSLVGDATNRSESIAIDKSGNIVTIGRQRGTVDFDPGPNNTSITTSTTKDALFIQKMSEDSSFLWVRSIVSTSNILGLSVITDSSNSIFISGFFLGTADFDPGPSTFNLTASPVSLFVVKLDENGDFFNAIKIGAGNSTANTIALSNDNGILLSGTFSSTVDFDPGPGTETKSSLGGEDSYILKLKNDLTFGWVKTFGGSLVDYGRSIIQSKNKNIYITGYFQGTVDFDPGIAISNLTSNGGFDVFIAKYDSSGSFIWAKKTGGSGDDYGFSVTVDKNENVYCLGRFSGAIDVNPNAGIQIITSSSQNNHYLQKLDPSGSFVFGRSLFGSFQDTDRNLCIGDSSIIYVTSHNLLGKYDSIGNLLTSYSPFGFPSPLAITCNDANDVYLTGYFSGTVNFSSIGGGSLNATPGADVFIARLSSLNSPDTPTIGLSSNDSICLGDSVDLFISSGNLNDATAWTWYSASCGGTLLGTGDTIRVSPTSSTAYFVRGEGGGVTPGTCASQTIVPGNTGGGVSASVNDTLVCLGDPLTFTASGGTNYQWSGGITNGQTFTTTSPGILLSYVSGEDAFGCTSEDSVYSFVAESYSLADKGKFIGSGFESYIPLYFYCDAAETDSSLYNFNSHWISFLDIFGFIFAPFGSGCPSTTSINQSSDAYEGLNALRMDADTNGFAEASISGILAGRPNKLQGYFKTNAGPNDTIAVLVGAVETGLPASSQDSANYIGYGEFVSTGSTGTYTQFEVPINYSGSAPTDSFEISLVFVNSATSGGVKSLWFDAFNLVYDTTVLSICSGDSAFLGGAWQTTAGLYTDNLLTEFGCDSVVIVNLEIINSSSGSETATACDTYTWSTNGQTYTTSGIQTAILTNAAGCDSVVTLDLTITNSSSGTDVITACDSYTWIDGNTYTASNNSATFSLTNAVGCDSVVTLDLTITNSNSGTDVITACDSYTWIDGNTYTSNNNTATFTLTNASGCDSIVTLDLTITNSNLGTDVITACDSYTWIDGNTYTSNNNTATFTLTNAAGCDSVVTLDLTITNSNTGTDVITACDSYQWIDGNTYTASNNTASFTLTNATGCDSIVTLDLTINNSSTSSETVTACDSYTWPANGQTYTASGTPTATLTNAAGCDSIVTLNLTISNSNTGTDVITACDSYQWIDGNTYTSSNNTATFTLTNAAGCDSVVTLDLTINNSNSGTDVVTACDSYQWIDGNTYTSNNNTATFTLTNAAGCDSVVTLNLTINNSTTGSETITACDSYTWPANGQIYTSSGTQTATLTNSAGCDSVVTLNLTINNSTTGSETITACDSYTWPANGQTYTSSGTQTTTLTNAAGCDSVVTLNLTINSSATSSFSEDICSGDTYIFGTQTLNSGGTFTEVFTGANGCDSTVTLTLGVITVDTSVSISNNTLTANATGATYQWVDCNNGNAPISGETGQSFTATQSGNYAVIVTEGNCTDTSDCINLTIIGLNRIMDQSSIALHPNPTKDRIYLQSDQDLSRVQIKVISAEGVEVLRQEGYEKESGLNTSSLASGMYYLIVEGEQLRAQLKFVKE